MSASPKKLSLSAALVGRLMLPICLGLLVPPAAMAEGPQARRPASAAEPGKDKHNACPVRWGKRPRRSGGPGAEAYVIEWGPCKADALPAPAPSGFMQQSPTIR